MAVIRSWSGDWLSTGPLTTSSAGTGDTSFNSIIGSGLTVRVNGFRPSTIELVQSEAVACAMRWNLPTQSAGAFRFYWTSPASWPTSSFSIFRLTQASTYPLNLNVMVTGNLRIFAPGGVQVAITSNNTLQLNTRYRIEGRITQSGASGFCEVKLFAGDSTTEIATISGTADYGTSHDGAMFGNVATTPAVGATVFDDMAVADAATYIGPYVTSTNASPTAQAGSDQSVVAGQNVALNGSGADSDGSIASYEWTQLSGPTVQLGANTGLPAQVTIGTTTTSVADPDTSGILDENSGLVISRVNTTPSGRIFWGHNDSGGVNTVYAFDDVSPYSLLAAYTLGGTTNVDWEDIALGPGPNASKSYLYVGNIGASASTLTIHRFEEPGVAANQAMVTATIPSGSIDTFTFSRPAGTNDFEGFFVDPISRDIFLFQKQYSTTRPQIANVYKIPAAQLGAGSRTVTPTLVTTVRSHDQATNHGGLTAADITADGRYFAICSYQEIWLWTRDVSSGQTVDQALIANPVGPAYQYFASGWGSEAIAFDTGANPGRLYTMSEGASSSLKYVDLQMTSTGATAASVAFTAPYRTTDSQLRFQLTVTDNQGASATDTVDVTVAKHRRWIRLSDRLAPLIKNAQSSPDPIAGSVSSTSGDGVASLTWAIDSGGHSVTGVYVGRDGTDTNGNGPWETFRPLLSGTQNFSYLQNGVDYTLYAQPVVDGVRGQRFERQITPQGAAPPEPTKRWMGIYSGGPSSDSEVRQVFGTYPDIATTYVQPEFQGWNLSTHTARVNLGISPLLTWTTKYTSWIADIADSGRAGHAAAIQKLDQWISYLDQLSRVDLSIPVWGTFSHEHDVYSNPDRTDIYYTGLSADPAVFGAALSVFLTRAKAAAPYVKWGIWFGGHRTAHIATVLDNVTVAPDWLSFDPYVNSKTYESATENFTRDTANCRNSGGAYRASYLRLGEPPIGISEHGISKLNHSDSAMANYCTDLRTTMEDMDLIFTVYFNRDSGPQGSHRLDDGNHPLAVAAFSQSLQG